jgi:hypothetical protein
LGAALLAAAGVAAQESAAPPVRATDSRFVRQFNKRENFVDTGVASSTVTRTRRSQRVTDDTPRIPYSFFFAATFKNDGDKLITALEWDYVLTDKKDAQHEILRTTIRSEKKIPPGAKRTVESRERGGLDHIWKVRKDADKSIVITRIEYADGTVWAAGKLLKTTDN